MQYCRHCGKQLTDTETYCPDCGTKIEGMNFSDAVSSLKRGTVQTAEKISDSIKKGDYKTKFISSYNDLGEAKKLFWITFGLFLLNIIISFMDMLEFSWFFSARNDSFISLMRYLKENDLSNDAVILLPVLRTCTILTIVSLLIMSVPILTGKEYKRKYLAVNYPTVIFILIVYIVLILIFSTSQYEDYINIKFMAYFYLIETIAAFVSTVLFSRKIKLMKKQSDENLDLGE